MRPTRRILAALCLLLGMCGTTGWAQEVRERPAVHVVRQGETVDSIARRYAVSERDLATWNNLSKPYKVKAGQKLLLAAPAAVPRQAPKTPPAETVVVRPQPIPAPPVIEPTQAKESTAPSPGSGQGTEAAGPAAASGGVQEAIPSAASGRRTVVEAPDEEASRAQKQEVETLRRTTNNLINLLVETGVLSREKAEELVAQAKRDAAEHLNAMAGPETKVIRVPYVPQTVREEIKRDIRREVVMQAKTERWGQADAVPEWTERIKISGDIRLRSQSNRFDANNAPNIDVNGTNQGNGLVIANNTQNFDLWRYQARLGVDAQITPRISLGLRVTTGTITTPVSFDQTLGNTFNKNSLVLDRAFLQARPWDWMTVWAGRIANPWVNTDLVWDPDISLDGVAAKVERSVGSSTRVFLTGGAHPIEFVDCSVATQATYCGRDKWLYAGQLGVVQEVGSDVGFLVAATYYDFRNLAAPFNDPVIEPLNRSNLLKFVQRGNTVYNIVTSGGNPLLGLAADYRLIDLIGSFDYKRWDPAIVNLTVDYVENVGYDRAQILARTGGLVNLDPRTRGYQVRLSLGQKDMKQWGDWQVFGVYKYLQRDAVVDAFTDSDFALGGTDAKGYIIGGLAGLAKNTWVRLRWLSSNAIDGPPRAVDVLQLDLNARF